MRAYQYKHIKDYIDEFMRDVDPDHPFVYTNKEGIHCVMPVEHVLNSFRKAYTTGFRDALIDAVIKINEEVQRMKEEKVL
jgi:hypothetical protein